MPQELRVSIGQHSLAGRKPVNQDSHGVRVPTGEALASHGVTLALADGLSGSPVSHQASAQAVQGFLQAYYQVDHPASVEQAARPVLEELNHRLYAQTQSLGAQADPRKGQVCAFSALILRGREGHLLHVGDCRIYRLQAQTLEPLTQDHRVRGPAVLGYQGRALGLDATVAVDDRHWPLAQGEVYLLTTEGAYEYLNAADVQAALARHPDQLDAAASTLAAMALERCSQDNITVLLVRIDALPPGTDAPRQDDSHLPCPPPLQAGMSFEGCTLVRELHHSARSQVWLAVDGAQGETLALKVPAPALQQNLAALARFQHEEWVARRIDNPHVRKPAASERPHRYLCVALAYVEGQTLAQWMADHPRPELDAVRQLVMQIARGLQAFHRRGLLYGGLSPDNVLIDRTGTVQLIDFGAVRAFGLAEDSAPAPDAASASPYSAPECATGGAPGPQADLFALAVLTYQMLSGQLPYPSTGATPPSPADWRHRRAVPLRAHRPDLPAWLEAVLNRALQPQPQRRPELLSEFTHALTAPGPAVSEPRPLPLIERHPVRFWQTVSAVLGLLVIGLTAALLR